MNIRQIAFKGAILLASFTLVLGQEAPRGAAAQIKKKEQKALDAFKGKVKGKIIWSTSRSNSKHDIWLMNADGSAKKQLTKSDNVDWFPRFSPDGQKVIFVRSKSGWVPETDAKYYSKWELWTVNIDGSGAKKVVDEGCWGTWRPDGHTIVFARGTKVFTKNLESGTEEMIFDGEASIKKGTIVQHPGMSPNGKYLAATLRGGSRETGIWNFEKKTWTTTGKGCQIDWFPTSDEVFRMNPTGNGGTAAPSEILALKLNDGIPTVKVSKIKKLRLMDLPGRRSHEYFPKFSQDGKWMVWGATAKGHEHDIYDYEIYIWKRGESPKTAVRLTFHTGNDRWPDIHVD